MMKSDAKSPSRPAWVRKMLVPALAGGAVGFGTAWGIGELTDGGFASGLTLSAEIALVAGALYLVMALGVLIGTLRPGFGARYLNVEDADELRETRVMLVNSCIAMAMWGAGLAAFALASPGPLSSVAALAIGMAGMALGSLFAWRSWKASDELMAAVTRDANSLTALLAFAMLGGWGALAHIGYLGSPAPLDLLTSFFALGLLATFIVVGRRGMMRLD
ncbi:MAG: hypothetical protein V2I39_08900 [Erythrobacter sp.]|jgi:hypothetical protein|nr:hypothetical protein [Erythrobacter sp.]